MSCTGICDNCGDMILERDTHIHWNDNKEIYHKWCFIEIIDYMDKDHYEENLETITVILLRLGVNIDGANKDFTVYKG